MTMKFNSAVDQMQLVSDAQIYKYFIVFFEYLFYIIANMLILIFLSSTC